jgi:UDP-N-acetylmuramate dehydrogenase
MQIHQNISLKAYNTFGIDVLAKSFASFSNIEELAELLQPSTLYPQPSTLILGGGSNILFTKNFEGLVLKNELKGIELLKEDAEHYYVKAAAGEAWHEFVLHCINHNYAGVENLSLIPGNVGASPMQNIGAYGVEIKDVFHELEAYHVHDKQVVKFSLNECAFGYRESVFKRKYKDLFVILNVTYKLNKQPGFNTSYGAINQELEAMGIRDVSIQAISQAVINIRSSKLPNPKEIGNAGSFFKNPTISVEQLEQLKKDFPNIPNYPVSNIQHPASSKLAAGWLIEQCGWKGFRKNDAGCHAKQALVLVNYGHASGKEVFDLSEDILQSVKTKFGVLLEREVNIL